jgi:hypothetical protein
VAVSVKMNVLLYAPPLLLLMLKVHTIPTVEYAAFVNITIHWQPERCSRGFFFFSHMQAMDIGGVLLALAGAALVQVP